LQWIFGRFLLEYAHLPFLRAAIPRNNHHIEMESSPMKTRSFRLLALAFLTANGLGNAAILTYNGVAKYFVRDEENILKSSRTKVFFVITESDTGANPYLSGVKIWHEEDTVWSDAAGNYSVVVGKKSPIPNSVPAGKAFYLEALQENNSGFLVVQSRRLKLLSTVSSDCQVVWRLDLPATVAERGTASATNVQMSGAGQNLSTVPTDPSMGLSSMSGLGELVGTAPSAGPAGAQAAAPQPVGSSSQSVSGLVGTVGAVPGAGASAAQTVGTQIVTNSNCEDVVGAGEAKPGSTQLVGTVVGGAVTDLNGTPLPKAPSPESSLIPSTTQPRQAPEPMVESPVGVVLELLMP